MIPWGRAERKLSCREMYANKRNGLSAHVTPLYRFNIPLLLRAMDCVVTPEENWISSKEKPVTFMRAHMVGNCGKKKGEICRLCNYPTQ